MNKKTPRSVSDLLLFYLFAEFNLQMQQNSD